MEPHDQDVDTGLRESLKNIDAAADLISVGVELSNPDRLEADLDRECGLLRDSLASLMSDPTAMPNQDGDPTLDFGQLAREAATEALASANVPVQLHVTGQGLVQLPGVAPAAARAAVGRMLRIAVEHAGAGGEVTVTPSFEAGCAVLLVEARNDANTAGGLPPELRCRSLEDFVAELGGRLRWSGSGPRELAMRLHLGG